MDSGFLFTSESVTEGHPDKIADQISDAVVDAALAGDPYSRVACETMLTTGLIVVAGEITTTTTIDYAAVARKGLEDLRLIKQYAWQSSLGMGVIDVKSPVVETPDLVATRIRRALEYVEPDRLMINPDCGLRHLTPEVARRKLHAMVAGTAIVRSELGLPHPAQNTSVRTPASGVSDSITTGESHG